MLTLLGEIIEPFFSRKEIFSFKNGKIKVTKFFGKYSVVAGGCFQSGPYVDRLFRKLLKKVPRSEKIKSVLVLGLGAGGVVREILKRFPQASIVAVEHDPVMIGLSHNYLGKKYFDRLELISEDAGKFVAKTAREFDIIIVDLFKGSTVSHLLQKLSFVKKIGKLLQKDGYLLINFYRDEEKVVPIFDKVFSRWQNLKYSLNRMAVYRHFGQGKIGDPLPEKYINKEQSQIYLKTLAQGGRLICAGKVYGIRKKFGFFYVESYVANQEPKIEKFPHIRIIFWQPLTKKFVRGWLPNLFSGRLKQIGIAKVDSPRYFRNWSKHAQRHRKKWLNQKEFEISETDFETFKKAYHFSKSVDWFLRIGFLRVIKYHLGRHKEDVHLFCARSKKDGKIIGGLAVVDYPDISQSTHVISFISPFAKNTSVGVGLIDHWHQHALENKLRFLNFGLVWRKGNPRAWKGYSRFKKQFNLYLLVCPRSLIKFRKH